MTLIQIAFYCCFALLTGLIIFYGRKLLKTKNN